MTMGNFEEVTLDLGTLYEPKSALIIYQSAGEGRDTYVEHFDLDSRGNLINAHPLTVREALALSRALDTGEELDRAFLRPKGILPTHVLHINPSDTGGVIWYTKPMERDLFFVEDLGIPNGKAHVPSLLWHADRQRLRLFALATQGRPRASTPLYHAPFLNIGNDGNVCMGTVDVNIQKSASLEEFIQAWEIYFFHSYFSHLLGHNPIKGNCVSLWKKLVENGKPFPKEVMVKNNRTLKDILR